MERRLFKPGLRFELRDHFLRFQFGLNKGTLAVKPFIFDEFGLYERFLKRLILLGDQFRRFSGHIGCLFHILLQSDGIIVSELSHFREVLVPLHSESFEGFLRNRFFQI